MGKFRIISSEEVRELTKNMFVTPHARKRMRERGANLSMLNNPVIAYQGIDHSYNIATDDYKYFVIENNIHYGKTSTKKYVLVTYNDKNINGVTIWDRIEMEKLGIRGKHKPKYIKK